MGSRDIVKYVVACSGILKPNIAKWEYTPPTSTPNKATSNFSYTLQVQYNLCQRPPV